MVSVMLLLFTSLMQVCFVEHPQPEPKYSLHTDIEVDMQCGCCQGVAVFDNHQ